jgi:ABC-type glycerol-3-phosphate transport system permease component
MSARGKEAARNIVLFALLLAVTSVILFPVYWLFVSSIKVPEELFHWPVRLFPSRVTLSHYISVLFESQIPRFALNSVIITLVSSSIVVALSALAGYGFSRFSFPGKRFFYISFLAIRMFPLVVTILPLYLLWSRLGLLDSFVSLVVTYVAIFVSLGTWLLKSFFDEIDVRLEEAALIDGATRFQCLTKVVLPLARPGIAAVFIFIFVFVWNEYMIVLTLTETNAIRPISVGLVSFMGQYNQEWGAITAAAVLSMLPILVLFSIVQGNFIKGLAEGGIKG